MSTDAIHTQYKDATNLNARIALHACFSRNPYPWHRWLFDSIDLPAEARILELGCGSASLWIQNLDRLPAGWDITLTDFSEGMLAAARRNLCGVARPFVFEVVDARSIPYDDATFDAIIANHMLYHVPERAQALAEIRRVLRPGGRLYASTVGEAHMHELWALVEPLVPGICRRAAQVAGEFTLENGAAQLAESFTDVRRYDYEDGLTVTDPEPVVAYVLSSNTLAGADLLPEQQTELRARVATCIAAEGALRITKASGLFVATR